MKKHGITFCLLFLPAIFLMGQRLNFGDSISIRASSVAAATPYWLNTCGFVRAGWHKIVKNNITTKIIGASPDQMQSTKWLKDKINTCNEFKSVCDFVYGATNLDHLQYVIRDNDTVNYYDNNGYRQGLFITNFYLSNSLIMLNNHYSDIKAKSPLSYYFYRYSKFNNDTLFDDLWLGIQKDNEKLRDTIEHNFFLNDSTYCMRSKINPDFYVVKCVKHRKGQKTNWEYTYDTIRHYYNSGELYSIGTAKVYPIYGMIWYGPNLVYWKNGNLMYEWIFINGLKEGLCYEYREDGTKYREMTYKAGKLITHKCFDLKGKNEVPCQVESNKK